MITLFQMIRQGEVANLPQEVKDLKVEIYRQMSIVSESVKEGFGPDLSYAYFGKGIKATGDGLKAEIYDITASDERYYPIDNYDRLKEILATYVGS